MTELVHLRCLPARFLCWLGIHRLSNWYGPAGGPFLPWMYAASLFPSGVDRMSGS